MGAIPPTLPGEYRLELARSARTAAGYAVKGRTPGRSGVSLLRGRVRGHAGILAGVSRPLTGRQGFGKVPGKGPGDRPPTGRPGARSAGFSRKLTVSAVTRRQKKGAGTIPAP